MSWNRWLHGMAAAVIGSFSTALGSVVGGQVLGYDVFDISFWQIVGGGLIVNSLVAVGLYIKQFPPPGLPVPTERPFDAK